MCLSKQDPFHLASDPLSTTVQQRINGQGGQPMWAIDRSDLIILGVVLGILALVGLTLLFSPADQLAPISPSKPTVGMTQPTLAPGSS